MVEISQEEIGKLATAYLGVNCLVLSHCLPGPNYYRTISGSLNASLDRKREDVYGSPIDIFGEMIERKIFFPWFTDKWLSQEENQRKTLINLLLERGDEHGAIYKINETEFEEKVLEISCFPGGRARARKQVIKKPYLNHLRTSDGFEKSLNELGHGVGEDLAIATQLLFGVNY